MPSNPVHDFFHYLHERTLDQADDLQPALQRMINTNVTGSPADADFKKVSRSVRSRDRQDLWQRVQINCLHSTAHAHDHVRALALLLASPDVGVPVYAHATVARAALESAVNVAHVFDPAETFDVRFARGIAFLISDSSAALRAAKRVPGNAYMQAPGPRLQRRHDDLLALITGARIEITSNRNGDPKGVRTSPGGREAPIDVKMTDLVAKQYPGLPSVYNLMSGVTHGLPYKLADNARIADRQAAWDTDPLDVAASVLGATIAAHTLLAHVGWHRGATDDPAVASARDRIAGIDAAMIRFGKANLWLPQPKALRTVTPTQ